MKKLIILFIALKIFAPGFSHAQITFNTTYHNYVDNDFNILIDSLGYKKVMASYNPPFCQYIFQELDLQGIVINSKTYGTSTDYFAIYSLLRTFDANYAIGSYYRDLVTGNRFAYLAKLNGIGDTLWTRKFAAPTGFHINGQYMIETSDHGFLITGQIVDSLSTEGDIFILKADSVGNFLWSNTFGGIKFDGGSSSLECPDGGFLTAGWTRSFGFGNSSNRDDIVVKWDSLGNYQWHETYGSSLSEYSTGIVKVFDGNYVLSSGRFNQSQTNNFNGKIFKIDINGNLIWQKFQSDGIVPYTWVREMSNWDLVGVGSRLLSSGLEDGFIVRTDSAGNEKWRRQYRYGNSHCYFRDIQETPDGGIICAGFVFDGASGGQDGWLVKLDSTGCLSTGNCGIPTALFDAPASSNYQISVYPNPIVNEAIIKFEGLPQELMDQSFKINIYDLTGRLLHSPQTGVLISGSGIQFIFNRNNLNSGVYLLEVKTYEGEVLGVVKIILE